MRSWTSRLKRWHVAVAAMALAACGSFSSGAADDRDAGPIDPRDGGVDTSVPPADGALSYCNPGTDAGHAFCEDFDKPNLETRWDTVAKAYEDDAAAVSLPHSLVASIRTGTSPFACGGVAPCIVKALPIGAAHFKVAFDLRVDTPHDTPPQQVRYMVLELLDMSYTTYLVEINAFARIPLNVGTTFRRATADASTERHPTLDNDFASFRRVELDLKTQPHVNGTLVVSIDGKTSPLSPIDLPPILPTSLKLQLGVVYVDALNVDGGVLVGAHFDNVTIDFMP